jgi:LPXTG-motif cell wall-anchored protein
MTGAETLQALAILAIAIGLAGIAILILFAKKKI